jgi:glycosyltransferase involved in cell wall biosynthesis
VDLLIDAFRALTDRHPDRNDVSLHIFGGIDSEELTDKLMSLAEDLNVTFHGRFEYEDLSAAGLNLAVFPSRCRETYGLVLDEAFELGLGVVVPNLGALPDRAGTAGLIFQAEDAASLAECLEQAMDPACRERLQASIPLSGLNAADHADKVIAIYADVLSDSERPRSRPSSVSEQRRADWLALRAENQFRRLME